jgi:hypothetical protein
LSFAPPKIWVRFAGHFGEESSWSLGCIKVVEHPRRAKIIQRIDPESARFKFHMANFEHQLSARIKCIRYSGRSLKKAMPRNVTVEGEGAINGMELNLGVIDDQHKGRNEALSTCASIPMR